jgi:putative ABC transport system permease protein
MFKNYLKIALRNIKRQKGYSFINMAGLAIGMACCILLFLWVQDELSFDRFHENADEIYRVISEIHTVDKITHNARTPNPLGPAVKEKYPEIINFIRYQGFAGWLVQAGDKSFINDNLGTADPSFFEMFTFPFLNGDPKTALNERYSIVITENMAKKYFGNEDPMEKIIRIGEDFKVTGVIKNIPENSHLHFDCIIPIINMETHWETDLKDWQDIRFYTYIQLHKKSSPEDVSEKISGIIKEYLPKSPTMVYLQPLTDVHLRSDFEEDLDNYNQGSIAYVFIFSITALGILLIACINFMNLSTARSANRAKEVGMRKVAGAQRMDIIKQFFGESILLAFIALIFALLLVELLLPLLNDLSGKHLALDFSGNIQLFLGLIAIALLTGLFSGSYPSLFLSSFQPVNIMKKDFSSKASSGSLRKVLVLFQFTLTIILLIGTTLIYSQLNYIRHRDLGFDKDHVLEFWTAHADYEALKNELRKNPNILNVTNSETPGREPWGATGLDWDGKIAGEEVRFYPTMADYDYLETLNLEMVEGRYFSKEFPTDVTQAVIVNEAAVKAMGMESPVGKRLRFREWEATIIGVIKDFHQTSLHNPIEPLVFQYSYDFPTVLAKISSKNVPETLVFLEKTWKKFVKNYPFTYEFLDEKIDNFYKTERMIGKVFQYFTSVAVLIACLGLFGLASFMAEQRTKEIGIRKVLGASVSGITFLLSKEFTKWVLVANAIAWPVAYYAMNRWLQGFAYRINIGIWSFVLSAVIAFLVALLTVSYQAIKAAIANPVESLRYE